MRVAVRLTLLAPVENVDAGGEEYDSYQDTGCKHHRENST